MNKSITESLISMNQAYELQFDDFAYKYDSNRAKEFEDVHYFDPIMEKIVPQISYEVNQNGHALNDYLEFIKPRYHDLIRQEVDFYEKNQEIKIRKEAEIIEKDFMETLLKYNTNPQMQEQEIKNFMEKHKEFYDNTALSFPKLYLKMVANIRSPRIQYTLINSKNIRNNISKYLDNLSKEEFDKILKDNFMYPMEIELETYYKKWIGKNKIHVKFCKNIFGNKYDYAKKGMKLHELGKWFKNDEGFELFEDI